jgi:zeaxanthin glucosyltransferase
MTHFGIISPPVTGHINPFSALGRELISRGHRVSFLGMLDLEQKINAEELEFLPIGQADHPRGSLPESLSKLGRLKGLSALRFTIDAVARTSAMVCRDAPRPSELPASMRSSSIRWSPRAALSPSISACRS